MIQQADSATEAGEPAFARVLGAFELTALGIGAIIGAGLFVMTGTAAAQYAGPAVVLSFALAGVGCLFTALCYAELASMFPVAGSAYTYAYASLGELAAWIIGWSLTLEYLLGAALTSVGWSGYFVALLRQLGISLPAALSQAPLVADIGWQISRVPGGVVNLPAMLLVLLMTAVVVAGIKVASNVNIAIVVVKVAIVVVIIGFGFMYVRPENWHPFVPPNGGSFGRFGWSGVLRGAAVVSLACMGFDAVSSASQEARNPQRDMPISIIGSLAACTVLYILMALVMTGLAPYAALNAPHPVFVALSAAAPALQWVRSLISFAVVLGLASVVLVMLLAMPRILLAMSRDGLLPLAFGRMHPRFRTPYVSTVVAGVLAALVAGFFPIGLIGELVTIGTLFVFAVVCIGVLVLRYKRPNLKRPFRTPLVPLVPVLGIVCSVGMMASLPRDTWIRLGVWMALGLVIYFVYGARHSRLSRTVSVAAD